MDEEEVRRRLNAAQRASERMMSERFGETRHSHWDREGKPIGLGDWAIMHRDDAYKRVAEARVEDVWVSTVWIGIDYGWEGPPLIFETMVFDEGHHRAGADMPGFTRRYSTEEEALAGHEEVVQEVREWLDELRRKLD